MTEQPRHVYFQEIDNTGCCQMPPPAVPSMAQFAEYQEMNHRYFDFHTVKTVKLDILVAGESPPHINIVNTFPSEIES